MKMFILLFLLIIGATLNPSFGAKITSDLLKVAKPGSAADKVIKLGDTREIRSNETTGALEFSNDGLVYKKIGAGAGGGSGILNDLANADFENGFDSDWTSSAGDTSQLSKSGCTLGTNCPLESDTSLRFSPDAQNDFFESSLATLQEGNYGRACEARIFYQGGDDQLEAQVINGDLETIATLTLKAHPTADFESVFFLCPTKAAIVADNDKGDLKIKINNTGASAAAASDWDDMHIGNLIDLVEVTTPDVLSAKWNDAGLVSESTSWISGCVNNGTGDNTCTLSGLSLANELSCSCTVEDGTNNRTCTTTVNLTTIRTTIFTANDAAAIARQANVVCQKQGSDAKQSVQVYKSIPKAAQSTNVFSGRVTTSTGSHSDENVDWISSCSNTGVGEVQCDLVAGIDADSLNCAFTRNTAAGTAEVGVEHVDSDTLEFRAADSGGTPANRTLDIICARGSDHVTPTVQPILVNQVETSKGGGIRTEACRVDNNGTATISTLSGLCESWIESVTRTGIGLVDVIYLDGTFSLTPVCVANATNSNNNHAGVSGSNHAARRVTVIHEALPTSNSDGNFYITCKGAR